MDGERGVHSAHPPSFDLAWGYYLIVLWPWPRLAIMFQKKIRDSRAAITQYTGTRRCVVEFS